MIALFNLMKTFSPQLKTLFQRWNAIGQCCCGPDAESIFQEINAENFPDENERKKFSFSKARDVVVSYLQSGKIPPGCLRNDEVFCSVYDNLIKIHQKKNAAVEKNNKELKDDEIEEKQKNKKVIKVESDDEGEELDAMNIFAPQLKTLIRLWHVNGQCCCGPNAKMLLKGLIEGHFTSEKFADLCMKAQDILQTYISEDKLPEFLKKDDAEFIMYCKIVDSHHGRNGTVERTKDSSSAVIEIENGINQEKKNTIKSSHPVKRRMIDLAASFAKKRTSEVLESPQDLDNEILGSDLNRTLEEVQILKADVERRQKKNQMIKDHMDAKRELRKLQDKQKRLEEEEAELQRLRAELL